MRRTCLPRRLFNHKGTVTRQQKVKDGQGGHDIRWVNVVENVPVRISPLSIDKSAIDNLVDNDKLTFELTHTLFCPADTDVREDDKVYVAGRFFDVIGIKNPSESGHHFELMCREVR